MKADEFVRTWTRAPWPRLAHISRYSSLPVLKSESVAEHCWIVAYLALAIAEYIELERDRYGTLLYRAIVHDMDEALSGDFIRPFKYANPELKKALDAQASAGLWLGLSEAPGGKAIYEAWLNAKDNDLEGYIIRIADLWSVYHYARREWGLGNAYIVRVFHELGGYFETLIKDIPEGEPELLAIANALRAEALVAPLAPRLNYIEDMADPYHKE